MTTQKEINLFDDDPLVLAEVAPVVVEPEEENPLKELVGIGEASLTTLIQIYQQIEEKLVESGGLVDFGDQMGKVEARIEVKLDNCKGLIDYWKGQVAYLEEREKAFKARKAGIKNGIEWLRGTMKSALLLTGKEKVKTN